MRDKITFDTTVGAYCLVEWDEDGNPQKVQRMCAVLMAKVCKLERCV